MEVYVDIKTGTWGDSEDLRIVDVGQEVLDAVDITIFDTDWIALALEQGKSINQGVDNG